MKYDPNFAEKMGFPLRNDMRKVVNLSVQRFLSPLFQGTIFLMFPLLHPVALPW